MGSLPSGHEVGTHLVPQSVESRDQPASSSGTLSAQDLLCSSLHRILEQHLALLANIVCTESAATSAYEACLHECRTCFNSSADHILLTNSLGLNNSREHDRPSISRFEVIDSLIEFGHSQSTAQSSYLRAVNRRTTLYVKALPRVSKHRRPDFPSLLCTSLSM